MKGFIKNIISVLSIWAILFIVSYFLSFNSTSYEGFATPHIMILTVVLIQIIFYFHSLIFKTDLLFDFIGSLTFITLVTIGFVFMVNPDFNKIFISFLLFLWASRLGIFLLFRRIKAKKDVRLQSFLRPPSRLFLLWNIQGIWIIFSSLPLIVVLSSKLEHDFGLLEWGGFSIWLIGFLVEVIADNQKRNFKIINSSSFINSGLWAYSRHPNYLGEILIWLGITVMSFKYLSGFGYIALITPLFVFVLLRYISGVPQLESIANDRWGGDDRYTEYKNKVGLLFPKLFND
ncbi:MAG: hypothetical protein CL762_05075 [Chloroflexi bacterium]|nr:hypothetical protein [Chloroflexota bacterium]MBM02070.1 hypothetical protein [Chloroflexota bacterium]|tara:strand:+ start:33 stop:899 length:867 start_codon:yes stop_codon:yes gene_type:complete